MSVTLDDTHDPALHCWVLGADGHADFPIQNLPFGMFAPRDGTPRAGVAIGDHIVDLAAALAAGLFEGDAQLAAMAACGTSLNAFLAQGAPSRRALRRRLSALLRDGAAERNTVEPLLYPASSCVLHVPAAIGDYTDFYVGIHHATAVGKLFRPDAPLLPNYKWVPIGYHGRASSIVPSGTPVRRPTGQTRAADAAEPSFGPCRRLDYELELGIWVGPGNALGEPIALEDAADHIAGFCLLNDWSARDVQAWEYQPLGPFLAKSFASTISPWIVTPEALAPFRAPQTARPEGDPAPLAYLSDEGDRQNGALAIVLEVTLVTPGLKAKGLPGHRMAISDSRHMYWSAAQLVAHHTSGGCNLRPGDLLGSGTLSGPDTASAGSMLEASRGGAEPIRLASGEERRFLEDGDEVVMTARCAREGYASIGFGECRGEIMAAR